MQPHLRKCFENIAQVGSWAKGSIPGRIPLLSLQVFSAGNEFPGLQRHLWGLWEEGQLPQLSVGELLLPAHPGVPWPPCNPLRCWLG